MALHATRLLPLREPFNRHTLFLSPQYQGVEREKHHPDLALLDDNSLDRGDRLLQCLPNEQLQAIFCDNESLRKKSVFISGMDDIQEACAKEEKDEKTLEG